MTDDRGRPPMRRSGSTLPNRMDDYLPPAPFGISALARWRNDSEARTLASYTAVEEEINQLIVTRTRQVELKSAFLEANARAVGRAEQLDSLREMAGLEVSMQLDELRRNALVRSKQGDVELARLEVQLQEARNASAQLTRSQEVQSREPRTATDEIAEVFAEARACEAAFDREIERFIDANGGSEARLSATAQDTLDQMRMLKANKIASIYERML